MEPLRAAIGVGKDHQRVTLDGVEIAYPDQGAGTRGRRWFRPAFAAYYRAVLQRAPAEDQRHHIIQAAYEIAPVLAEAWHSFSLPSSDLRPLIAKVTCPVLFAWARSDQRVSFQRSKQAVQSFPNASVEFFRGGHAPFLEDPDAFVGAFKGFIDGLPKSRSGIRQHADRRG